MKKIFLILILILSLAVCFSACKKDGNKKNENGQISDTGESATSEIPPDGEKIFYRSDGSLEKIVNYQSGKAVWIREYDENGTYIKYIEYTPYGHFEQSMLDGHIHDKITFYNTSGQMTAATEYEYYENGILSKETVHSDSGNVKEVYFYDSDGVNIKSQFYSSISGKYVLDQSAEFEYAPNGQNLKSTYYRGDGTLFQTHEYDENGHIVKNTYYDSDGNTEKYILYLYGENSKKTSETCYGPLGNILSCYLYKENGDKLKLINYSEDGSPSLVYEYGDSGNIKKIENYGENGILSSFEEFDEDGNKVRYTSYNDDRTFLVYDGNYNIVEGVCYTYHASGEFVKQEYLSGKVISKAVYDENSKISSLVRYDDRGDTIEEIKYTLSGEIERRTLYARDAYGEMINYTVYELGGTSLIYDVNGSIVSGVRCIYSKGELYKKDEYENGVRRKETLYSGGKPSLISEYDENEALEKESFYSSGKLSQVREYDSNGVLRKDTFYNSKGKATSVTKYDENGNKI